VDSYVVGRQQEAWNMDSERQKKAGGQRKETADEKLP